MTLELFLKHPDMDAYRVGGAYQPYAVVAVDKRFSDAELAAEFWAAALDANQLLGAARKGGKTHAAKAAMTLHRFATLPHSSDANYE